MKKLLNKLKKKTQKQVPPSRITNETVAEHREHILAGGRKFKYPVQYARHKLVINTILVSIASIALILLLCWWQLYPAQNTSGFMYRLTQIVPVPVATIDGQQVRYSDYLMRFRSSMHFLQQQNMINVNSADGKRQIDHIKRQSLDEAISVSFAEKVAKQKNITIGNDQIDAFIKTERESQQSPLSEQAYESVVLKGFYDWSLDEYKNIVKSTLMRREVSFAVDDTARQKINGLEARLKRGEDFAKLAKEFSDDSTKVSGGDVGFVARSSQDQSGLVKAAASLRPKQNSGIIKGMDGYYIVRLLEADGKKIRYARIKVALTEFTKQLTEQKQKSLQEYISVPRENTNVTS
ncbi:MAG TPA: peptidylprolyl isomerase [Candidatus Saccharimonadales bacterium]